MSKPTYWELLRDPRWQRKRLEVMQRDDFRCVDCGDNTTTLNVHHMYYAKGRKPWEYESESLVTLCEPCHGERTGKMADLQQAIGRVAPYFTDRLLGYLRALAVLEYWQRGPGSVPADSPRLTLENDDVIEGVADALGFRYELLVRAIAKDGTLGAAEYAELVRVAIVEQQTILELERRGAF